MSLMQTLEKLMSLMKDLLILARDLDYHRLSQMQVEALRRAATEQVRRTAGSVTSSADFQDFLNQNGGAAGVLKSAASNLFNQQLSKLKSIPGQSLIKPILLLCC
jgi:hypothetical protein